MRKRFFTVMAAALVVSGMPVMAKESPQDIYDADEKCLREISGITKRQIVSILQARSFDRVEKILKDCEKKKIYVLTKADIRYPKKAKQVKDAPSVLYYQGSFTSEEGILKPTVGIVGARRCTQEAKQCCIELTRQCIKEQEIVISGSNMDAIGFNFIFQSVRVRGNSGLACRVEGLERNMGYSSY